jgi:hypothetical protein
MAEPKQPVEQVSGASYAGADIYERFHNREFFYACCREGLRKAMLSHQKINNQVAIWRDGKVVLVSASEVLQQIDAA